MSNESPRASLSRQTSLGRLHNEFERGNEIMNQALEQAKLRQATKMKKKLAARRAKNAAAAAAAFSLPMAGSKDVSTPSSRRPSSALLSSAPPPQSPVKSKKSHWDKLRQRAIISQTHLFGNPSFSQRSLTKESKQDLKNDAEMSRFNIVLLEMEGRMSEMRDQIDLITSEKLVLQNEQNQLLQSLKIKEVVSTDPAIPIDMATNFLPNSVLKFVSTGESLSKPCSEMMEDATLLFLDISGYTKLAEKLGSIGAEGTEILSKSISTFFETAILLIYEHGGDVVKFCGDALMCVFEVKEQSNDEHGHFANHGGHAHRDKAAALLGQTQNAQPCRMCQLAMQCALLQMEKLRGFVAADGVVLDLKIMLGKGTLVGNYVGSDDINHWEYLLTGHPFNQISDAEHSANPGDIVLSPEVWFEAGDAFEGTLIPNTNLHLLKSQKSKPLPLPIEKPYHLWLEHSSTMEKLLEPSVVDQLRELHGSWTRVGQSKDSTLMRLSKHDDCSTIFILIKEEVNDTKYVESNLDKMQRAFMCCYQPLQKYGGMMRQFLMDDKGMVAILVFTGKESNATYACRCAIDVRTEMKKQSIECSLGIASGRVFCGPVGCPYRCEYAFVGDSVNLSARLMCKANTYAIITDRSTADSASRSIHFKEAGTTSLKGKSGKIPIFEVMHFKSNTMQLVNSTEQNFLTTDGKFDNLASFLPASILDIVIKHCKATLQNSYSVLSENSESDYDDNSSKYMVGQHTGSLMRQAVCIALKYHKEPTVKRERRRSLRTSQSSYAGKSAIDFEAWVDEVRAAAMDHGGDLVSISGGDTAVLLFFAGELSVRHHDTTALFTRQKSGLDGHASSTMDQSPNSNLTNKHRLSAIAPTEIELSAVAKNAMCFLTRKLNVTKCGLGIGNCMTVMTSTPFSGGYSHFGECIDQAHTCLELCDTNEVSNVCAADILPVLNETNLVNTISAKPVMAEQLEIAVNSIQSYVYLPVANLSQTGESLLRLSTETHPAQATCVIIRSRLCSEANSSFFGKDSNALNIVQHAIDDVTHELPSNDSYITSLEVSSGELKMTCIIERDVAWASYQMLQVYHKLARKHTDTSIFVSVGNVTFCTENGVFYIKGDCIDSATAMLNANDYPREPIVCDSSCPRMSSMPWLIGFRSLDDVYQSTFSPSPKVRKESLSPSNPQVISEETNEDDQNQLKPILRNASPPKSSTEFFAPFEKIPEIAEKVYSQQRNVFGHLEGRKEILEALKNFAITQDMTTVLVDGESGMGKTNMVMELKKISQQLGIRTIHSINQESDRTNSFHVWATVISSLLNPTNRKVGDLKPGMERPTISNPATTKPSAVQFGTSPLNSRRVVAEDYEESPESIITDYLPQDFPLDQLELLNDILPVQLRINRSGITRTTLDGDGGRKARLDLYASIIEHNCESQSPLVLILEDWEFADSLSWKLLFVVQQLCQSNLFIIVTVSSGGIGEDHHDFRFLKANPDLIQLVLHPLSVSAVKSMAIALCGVADLSSPITRALHKASDGIPMLVEQLVRHFQDTGALSPTSLNKDQVESVLWELKDFASTEVQMKNIADIRAATLSPLETMTLAIASVFQDLPFTEADIAKYEWEAVFMSDKRHEHIHKMTIKDTTECLKKLKLRGFVSLADTTSLIGKSSYIQAKIIEENAKRAEGNRERSESSGAEIPEAHNYMVRGGVISELILHHNLKAISAVHSKFAAYLEFVSRHDLPSHYAEIAHHHVLGNNTRKAQRFLLMAGDDAVAMCAPNEALELFNQFLNLVDERKLLNENTSRPSSLDLANTMSSSTSASPADVKKSKGSRRSTFFSISGKDQRHELGHIHRMMGEAYYYIGNFNESSRHLETALSYFGPAPGASFFRGTVTKSRSRMKAYIFAKFLKIRFGTLTHLYQKKGRQDWSLASRELATERCNAWFRLTQIHYIKGSTVSYAYAALQNFASSEPLGRSPELCNAITQFIPIASSMGYKNYAEQYCRESMQLSEQVDSQTAVAFSLVGRAVYMAGDGQLVAATDMIFIASQIFESVGNVQAWCECIAMMCVNHMALGAFLDMLDLAEAGISASLKVDNYTMIQWFLEMKMTGLISLGKTREAIEVMSDGSAGGFIFKKQVKRTRGEGGEASQRNVSGEFFLPEQGRGFVMEGKFEKAVMLACEVYLDGPSTSWWHYGTFSCCAEIFTLALLSARRTSGIIAGKTERELYKLANVSIGVLKRLSDCFEAVKPEYFLAKGRLLCAKGKVTEAQKILAAAVYSSDNFTLMPTKARACLEIAKSCAGESLTVRSYYAKTAGEVFENLKMKRMAMQANMVGIRLKPSKMATATMLEIGNDHNQEEIPFFSRGIGESAKGNGLKVRSEGVALTGRDEELSLLSKRASCLRTDHYVGSVLIEGDAGFGKTALLTTFLNDFHSAFSSFATALCGNALELEQEIPFHAWSGIMCSYFGIANDDNVGISKHKILSHLADTSIANLYPLLNPFLPFKFEDTEETRAMEPTGRYLKTLDFIVSLLSQGTAFDTNALILVIDDAQWCDSSSWNLISQVNMRAQNVMLIVTMRHMEGRQNVGHYKSLLNSPTTEHLVLGALPTSCIREYLCNLLQVRDVSQELLSVMETKACSNLLYVQEAVTSMVESGVLTNENGVCVLRSEWGGDMPGSIGAVIGSRIERLTAPQQQVLCCAACIGNEFALETLLLVHPAPDLLVTVQDDIRVLIQRNLIEPIGNTLRKNRMNRSERSLRIDERSHHGNFGDEGELPTHQMFQFVHKFTQETAYNRMLVSTRRQVHLMLAQHIEVKHANDIRSHYAVLADHYLKAEKLDEAKIFLLNAGDTAIECCASSEALKFFSKALEIIQNKKKQGGEKLDGGGKGGGELGAMFSKGSDEEGHIWRQIGEANYALSNFIAAKRGIIKALECFGENVGTGGIGVGFFKRTQIWWFAYSCHKVVKKAWVYRGDFYMEEKARMMNVEKARAWYRLAQISFLDNEPIMNLKCVVKGIHSAARLGPSLELSNALSSMIPLMSAQGFGNYAESFSETTMKMSQELQNKEAIAICSQARSLYLAAKGNLLQSEEQLKTAKDICEATGDTRLWNECNNLLCSTLHAMGKFKDEYECARNAVRITEQTADKPTLASALRRLVGSLLAMGNYEEAKEVHWRCDDLKDGVNRMLESNVGRNESALDSEADRRNTDTRSTGVSSGGDKDKNKHKRTNTHSPEAGGDHIELAGERITTLSTRAVQNLLLLLEEGKDKDCFFAAQKLMKSKTSSESSLWYTFDSYVILAEIFAELIRKITEDETIHAIGGCDEKKMLGYLKKVVVYVKNHMQKFKIAEPAYYYVMGLYSLYKNERQKSKWQFEKAVVTGKSLQLLAIVAKSYYNLGTNNWTDEGGGTKSGMFKNSVVGGSAYAVVSPEASRKINGRGHAHYLHRAFVFAKTCDMASLQALSKAAIDECISDGIDGLMYDGPVSDVGEGMSSEEDRETGKWVRERRISIGTMEERSEGSGRGIVPHDDLTFNV
ncbi:hypothetical protein TrLO_g15810 [Triparma laevis f. longispina]|uniref:Guanylate cyclase domain-containing protein n=1 Tax=Triparma laevis f. longispina TaxID=1714387 RepID=A0A9W6ZPX9_9STRA|nr:hypothetical protein TrLO_g15810 [Triparma laevis f. longispina]